MAKLFQLGNNSSLSPLVTKQPSKANTGTNNLLDDSIERNFEKFQEEIHFD